MTLGDTKQGRLRRPSPQLAHRFLVEMSGITEGAFSECSGLEAELELEDRRAGGVNDFVYRLPRGRRYPNITLRRGIVRSSELWDWFVGSLQAGENCRNCSILLTDETGSPQWRWDLEEAFPVKWTGPEFRADRAAVAVETLELVHRGFTTNVL